MANLYTKLFVSLLFFNSSSNTDSLFSLQRVPSLTWGVLSILNGVPFACSPWSMENCMTTVKCFVLLQALRTVLCFASGRPYSLFHIANNHVSSWAFSPSLLLSPCYIGLNFSFLCLWIGSTLVTVCNDCPCHLLPMQPPSVTVSWCSWWIENYGFFGTIYPIQGNQMQGCLHVLKGQYIDMLLLWWSNGPYLSAITRSPGYITSSSVVSSGTRARGTCV